MASVVVSWRKRLLAFAVFAYVGANSVIAAALWLQVLFSPWPDRHGEPNWDYADALVMGRPFLESGICIAGLWGLVRYQSTGKLAVLGPLAVLLLIHLIDWFILATLPLAAYHSLLEWHGKHAVYAAALAIAVLAWVPNNSSKPTPLRDAA